MNNQIIIKLLVLVCVFNLVFFSCNVSELEEDGQLLYYKEAQLVNIFDNEVTRLNAYFLVQSIALNDFIGQFKNQPNLENLGVVQNQWKETMMVWKRLELYNVGEVADSFIHFQINRWPTNGDFIEDFISGTEVIDEAFIASKGSSSKGISALEYLLFSNENTQVLNNYTNSPTGSRRLDYLVAVSENLVAKSREIGTIWETSRASFVGSLNNGISGSQNEVVNALITLIEEIIITKLGAPLGDDNGGTISIEKLEGNKSGTSLNIIKNHLISLERCYQGDFSNTPFRVGFDDYLDVLAADNLAIEISESFSRTKISIDNISSPLKEELLTNPESVEALKDAFRELLVLIKVDMANVIGSTVTFNDNDGD